MHRNEDIFPNPNNFNPDRWLNPTTARKLDKYLVPFSKGSRQCIGMPYVFLTQIFSSSFLVKNLLTNKSSLAYCEIYVSLGTLFRRYQALKPMPLSAEDLQYEDYFAPYRPITAKKFHVTV